MQEVLTFTLKRVLPEAVKEGSPYGPEIDLWEDNRTVIGIDEAGRGPLAGPVVAGAVIFEKSTIIKGMNDSKVLNEKKRLMLEEEIREKALAWAVGEADRLIIDEINILQATRVAMKNAAENIIHNLKLESPVLIVDGRIPNLELGSQYNIIKGDRRSFSIGAASILAKNHRDRLMIKYDEIYPGYGFAKHKGYPTKFHAEALRKLGPSPIHRRSFELKGWG